MGDFVAQCTAAFRTPEFRQMARQAVAPLTDALAADLAPYLVAATGALALNTALTLLLIGLILRGGGGPFLNRSL